MKQRLLFIAILGIFISGNLFAKTGAVIPYKPEEKVYWDFLRERLFDKEYPFVSSFQGDILIYLGEPNNEGEATKQDSCIVENLINELRDLIPDRTVRFSNKHYEVDTNNKIIPSIHIGFNVAGTIPSNGYVSHSKNINGNQIFYDGFKGIYQPEIYSQSINIKLNDSISFTERKRYIEYAIITSMCVLKGNPLEAHTFFENAILNDFDYNPLNTEFSEVDKFVISKLYAEDFYEQFKNYMLANYSWRYYLSFMHKSMMRTIGIFVSVLLVFLFVVIFYKPIIRKNYRNRYYAYIVPGVLITILAYFILLVYQYITTSIGITSVDVILGLLAVSIMAIVFSIILYFIERFSINPQMNFSSKLTLKMSLMFIIIGLPLSVAAILIRDVDNNRAFVIIFIASLTTALGRGIVLYLKHVGDIEIREKDMQLMSLKEINARIEIQSLHARINPHFLYNSLNSIAGLAHRDADKTEKMALSLSDMFRYSLNRETQVMTEIYNEVEMVRSYLEIEQIRFGERMSFSIEIDEETSKYLVPKFILQPLVENAIKHGISKTECQGEIVISIVSLTDKIEIKVVDNGPGFQEGLVAGYGLQSLYDLLEICYKGEAEVNWQNSPDKHILVKIPFHSNSIEV